MIRFAPIFVVSSVVSAYILIYVLGFGLEDNGDGWRVLRSAFVSNAQITIDHELSSRFPMESLQATSYSKLVPYSPAAFISLLIALISKVLGLQQFYVLALTTVYVLVFYVGVALNVRACRSTTGQAAVIAAAALFMLNPYLASYWSSVYEEASIFALTPLWYYAAVTAFERKKNVLLFLMVTLLIVTSKPIMVSFMLLPLCLCIKYREKSCIIPTSLIVAAFLVTLAKSERSFGAANAFNRVFNGLAYSVSDVSDWSVTHFPDRRDSARTRIVRDSFLHTGLPGFAAGAWGLSYWPDGKQLPHDDLVQDIALGNKFTMVRYLAAHPRYGAQMVTQSFQTALKADFSLAYIARPAGRPVHLILQNFFRPVQQYFGYMFFLGAAILVYTLYLKRLSIALIMFISVLSPLVVVLGDGYYEFEKHIMPFLVMIWFASGAALMPSAVTQRHQPGRQRATEAVGRG